MTSAQDYIDDYKDDRGTDMDAQEIINMASRKKVIIKRPPTGAARAVKSVGRASRTVGKVSGRIFHNIGSSFGKTVNAVAKPYGNSKPKSIFNPITGGMFNYGGSETPRRVKVTSKHKNRDYVVIGGKRYVSAPRSKKKKHRIRRERRDDYDRGFNPVWGN